MIFTGFPVTQMLEMAKQQGDLSTLQLTADIKNDCDAMVNSDAAAESMLFTVSIKSEPDLSPYVCTQNPSMGVSCCPGNLDSGHELLDLKSEVKLEMTTDESQSLQLAERIVDPFHNSIMSNVKVDEAEEVRDIDADSHEHLEVSLNALQEESLQETQGVNSDNEVLSLTEPEKSYQEGRVCHALSYRPKAKPGVRQADEPNTQPKNLRDHLCIMCEKSYSSARALSTHMKIHNGGAGYVCPSCGKTFLNKGNMIKHIRVHTGEKPYVCQLCGKAFPRSDSLVGHMRIHTGERKEVPRRHLCNVCGKTFTKASILLRHQQRHKEDRPFTCKQCHKGFKLLCDLQDHQRSHTDTRPHVCTQCGHSFSRLYCLEKHLRIHTRQEPYCCQHCPKTFRYRYSLTCHMKWHTD